MGDPSHNKKNKMAKIMDKFIHLKTIAETLPHLVWIANPNGDIDYYNQRWFDYSGTTFARMVQEGWEGVLHPDDLQNYIDQWQNALHSCEYYEVEYRLKRASDGSYRWHLGRFLPIKEESNEVVKWFGTSTDIDDLKQTHEKITKEIASRKEGEKEISLNERKISLIIENSYDAFIGIDEDNKIIAWNAQAEKIFGWNKKEAIGENLGELIIPDRYRDMHNAGIKRFISTGQGPRVNTRLQLEALNREQVEFPIELTVGAIKLSGKYEFFAFIHDISDRRKSENNLRRLSQTDFLTQAGNRAIFLTNLQNALQSNKSDKLIAVLFIDLDHFKKINDTHGHLIGDKVLQKFVKVCKKHLHENDTIARLGGDEFAIILEVGAKPNALEQWFKSLQKSLIHLPIAQKLSLTISLSVGVVFLSEKLTTTEQVMHLADTSLYEAKKAGRNQFFVFK